MLILYSASLVLLDYLSKAYISSNFKVNQTVPVIKNFFHITYVRNYGAAFGIMQNKKYFVMIITIISLIVATKVILTTKDKYLKFLLATIAAGAIGNFIDRIKYGYVVDMFDFRGIWSFVFNVADICVVVGISLLIIYMFTDNNLQI